MFFKKSWRLVWGVVWAAGIMAILPVSASVGQTPVDFDVSFVHKEVPKAIHMSAWVPDDVLRVRGMLLVCPGRGGDMRDVCDWTDMQDAARAMGFGIVGWQDTGLFWDKGDYHGYTPAESLTNLQAVLDTTAQAFSRPEVRNAPMAFYGLSKGGWVGSDFAADVPTRTLGFVADKSSTWVKGLDPGEEFVPGMFVIGSKDTTVYPLVAHNAFKMWRIEERGEAAQLVDWGATHQTVRADLFLIYLAQATRERYPQGQLPSTEPNQPLVLNIIPENQGWLGQSNPVPSIVSVEVVPWPEIAPYSSYSQNPDEASWLPNETMAMVYRIHNNASEGIANMPLWIGTPQFAYETGEPIDLSLTLTGITVDSVDIYHENELISVWAPGDGPVTFTATETGIHTFLAITSYIDGNQQTHMTGNYCAVAVIPEPATAGLLVLALATMLRLRRPGTGR